MHTPLNNHIQNLVTSIENHLIINEMGLIEILQKSLDKIVSFSQCKYGFIGIVDQQDGVLNYKYLVEKKPSNGFNPFDKALLKNPLEVNVSKAYQYLKDIPYIKKPIFSFDKDRAEKNLPWYSNILIPIHKDDHLIAVLGLNDRKKGFGQQFSLRMKPVVDTFGKVIRKLSKNTDINNIQNNSIFETPVNKHMYDMLITIDHLWNIKKRNYIWDSKIGVSKEHIMDYVFDQDYNVLEDLLILSQKTKTSQKGSIRIKKKKKVMILAIKVHYNSSTNTYDVFAKDITVSSNQNIQDKKNIDRKKILDFCFKNPVINSFF